MPQIEENKPQMEENKPALPVVIQQTFGSVTVTRDSLALGIVINNGTYDGKVKTATMSPFHLSSVLEINQSNLEKIMEIVALVEPCLAKELYKVGLAESSTLEEGA